MCPKGDSLRWPGPPKHHGSYDPAYKAHSIPHTALCWLPDKTTASPSRFQGRWIDSTSPCESSKADFRKAVWMGYIWWPSFGNIVCHYSSSGQNNSYRMATLPQHPQNFHSILSFISGWRWNGMRYLECNSSCRVSPNQICELNKQVICPQICKYIVRQI